MTSTTTTYVCPRCTDVYSSKGICKDCNISLVADDSGETDARSLPPAKQRDAALENFDGQILIDLMYEPVGLGTFRKKYPFLTEGPNGEAYVAATEAAMKRTKEKRILLRLQGGPRRWALKKQGTLGRLFNIGLDLVLWGAFYFVVLVGLIGSHKSGGYLRSIGLGAESIRGAVALAWFAISILVYTAIPEWLLGSTPGGLICRSAVVDAYGNRLSLGAALTRQLTKFLSPIQLVLGGDEDYEVVKR